MKQYYKTFFLNLGEISTIVTTQFSLIYGDSYGEKRPVNVSFSLIHKVL